MVMRNPLLWRGHRAEANPPNQDVCLAARRRLEAGRVAVWQRRRPSRPLRRAACRGGASLLGRGGRLGLWRGPVAGCRGVSRGRRAPMARARAGARPGRAAWGRLSAACGARGAQRSSGPRCRAARHPATPKHQTLTPCARSRSLSLSVGETGWGEFDITITVHFQPDANEKPLELAHMLKLYAAAGAGGAAGRSLRALSGAGGLPAAGRRGGPGAARRLAKASQRHRAPGG